MRMIGKEKIASHVLEDKDTKMVNYPTIMKEISVSTEIEEEFKRPLLNPLLKGDNDSDSEKYFSSGAVSKSASAKEMDEQERQKRISKYVSPYNTRASVMHTKRMKESPKNVQICVGSEQINIKKDCESEKKSLQENVNPPVARQHLMDR